MAERRELLDEDDTQSKRRKQGSLGRAVKRKVAVQDSPLDTPWAGEEHPTDQDHRDTLTGKRRKTRAQRAVGTSEQEPD